MASLTGKRSLHPESGPLSANKKARGGSDNLHGPDRYAAAKSTAAFPGTLSLSVLTWLGEPTDYNGDRNPLDGYVGEYRGAHTSTWSFSNWDESRQAFRYTPHPSTTSPRFTYFREAFTDTTWSNVTYTGGIICYEMPPLTRIGLPKDNLWPKTYRKPWIEFKSAGEPFDYDSEFPREVKIHRGPPFEFYECDTPRPDETPDEFFKSDTVLVLEQPDLPKQAQAGADVTEGREMDSTCGIGWTGLWVDALFELSASGLPLGERTKTFTDRKKSWEMTVKLKVVRLYKTEFDEEIDGHDPKLMNTKALCRYDVEAIVEALFVKPEWAQRKDGGDQTE